MALALREDAVGSIRTANSEDPSTGPWRPRCGSPGIWIALGILLAFSGVFFIRLTRGTTFWTDEWVWILHRRADTLAAFLQPHNEHLSLVPVTIYKLMFAFVGLTSYVPYRVMVIAAHLGCVVLVFIYARRRVGGPVALLVSTLMLFLGPAWQDIIWPFQVAWLLSLSTGVGALLLLDREDRRGDLAASCLLALSLASSGVGLAILVGLIFEVAFGRRRWRDAWIVAVPLVAYAAWWLIYQNTNGSTASVTFHHEVGLEVAFVAHAAASAASALVGLAANDGEALRWGRPLAALLAVALAWRLIRLGRVTTRTLTVTTILVTFWVSTAVARAGLVFGGHVYSVAGASRYLYVGSLFIVLLAVELTRDARLPRWATSALAVVVLAAVVSNVGVFRTNAGYLRTQAQLAKSDLGALEIGRSLVGSRYISVAFPGYPLVLLDAASYYSAARELGSPSARPSQITALPPAARVTADSELIRIHDISLQPEARPARTGSAPVAHTITGGKASRRGSCVGLQASGPREADLRLELPAAGVSVTAVGGAAMVRIRRFADGFRLVGAVPRAGSAALRVAPDRAQEPWHVSVTTGTSATVCGLG